jgi:hypothetical protein
VGARVIAVAVALLSALLQVVAAGRVAGIVTDSSGGVLPGVEIVVTDTVGQSRQAVTDIRGRYEIAGLTHGTYRAQARLAGLLTRRSDALKVVDQATTDWNVSLILLMGAIKAPASATVRDPTPIELARSVYTTALGAIDDFTTPATIGAVSLVVPAAFQEELWEEQLQYVPKDLREVVAAPSAADAVMLNPESLPSFAMLANRGVPLNVRSKLSLSRALVTASGLDALVVYTHVCGNVCGSGGAIWLHRASTASEWRVAGHRGFWVS